MDALCLFPKNLFLLSLVGNRFHRLADRIRVAQVIVGDWFQILIQLVHQRNTRGDIEFNNLVFRDVIQVFDQSPQAVAMRSNDDLLPGSYFRNNFLEPIGQKPLNSILQALRPGQEDGTNLFIAGSNRG